MGGGGGLWSMLEILYHITYLDFFLALKSFVGKKMGLVVLLKMDNITTLTKKLGLTCICYVH